MEFQWRFWVFLMKMVNLSWRWELWECSSLDSRLLSKNVLAGSFNEWIYERYFTFRYYSMSSLSDAYSMRCEKCQRNNFWCTAKQEQEWSESHSIWFDLLFLINWHLALFLRFVEVFFFISGRSEQNRC